MSRLKVCLTRRWPEAVEAEMAARFVLTRNTEDRPLGPAELTAAFQEHDVVCPTVSDQITTEVVAGSRARLLANYGVGFSHIDLTACADNGVKVTNTPGVLTEATADLAILLMLMASRRAGEGERELRAGRWSGWRPTHLLGGDVSGRTLGLVGFGRIAQATAERARFGFGMRILYFSRSPASPAVAERLSAERCLDLGELLERADIVSLHIPGGAATRGLVGARELARLRPHAVLVNTARGDVVDEAALAEALRGGRLAAAGLDVYAQEPQVPAALLALENVVLLPHLGSATQQTREAMGRRALANVLAFAAGEPLPDLVA